MVVCILRIIRGRAMRVRDGRGPWGWEAALLPQLCEQVDHLTEAVECQQVHGVLGGRCRSGIVRRTHGQGGVRAIRQLDDQVGISALSDAYNRDALTA
jgi:hypothetical protein